MKILYSVLAILAASVIIGMVTIGSQQIYAPRNCGGCEEIKQRTDEFINDFSRVVSPDSVKPLVKLTKAFEKMR